MSARPQRRALGALFLVVAAVIAGFAISAWSAGVWQVGIPASILALWLLTMSIRGFRAR